MDKNLYLFCANQQWRFQRCQITRAGDVRGARVKLMEENLVPPLNKPGVQADSVFVNI